MGRSVLSTAIGLTLAIVLLWWALRGVQWLDVWLLLKNARPRGLLGGGALATAALALRAVRWRGLLASGAVSYAAAFRATAAGALLNACVPARAGEVLRAGRISRESQVGPVFALATIVAERLADTAALLGLVLLGLSTAPSEARWAAAWLPALGVIVALCLGALLVAPFAGGVIASRLPERLRGIVTHAADGVAVLHDARTLRRFVLFTLAIWATDVAGVLAIGDAIEIDVPLPAACLLVGLLGLSSALPVTPGAVGVYQFVAVATLTPFGVSSAQAVAFILLAQALSLVVFAAFGARGLSTMSRPASSDVQPHA
jgi:uncharacterized protein (TIRG00374 family)